MGNNINYGKVKITKDEFYYLFCSAYAKLKNGKKLEGPELYIIKKYFELERDEGWSQRRIADKEKIDKNITDEKLKKAIYEILGINSGKY